jgi:hypothetical protein
MTDYVKSTNFTSKDSLSSGNPSKIVKGTEIDTEFNNIAVAVATKADTVSPALTGTPTAPTASSGTNTTQISTTAFVAAAIAAAKEALYPVGSIYVNAGVTTNPGTLLGFGTWTAFGAGRVMVGLNGSDSLFDALEETGGSKDAVVVSHNHTASTSISDPGHRHLTGVAGQSGFNNGYGDAGSQGTGWRIVNDTGTGVNTYTQSVSTGISASTSVGTTGSSGTNANLQPYITVAMWKRTA